MTAAVTPNREALLARIELALEQAQSCIKGETPEDVTFGEAEDDTFSKIRDALGDVATLRRLAAKPDDEVASRPEDIAIALCLVDGRNPDDEAPLGEMCDGDNMPVPWWMVYTEYAEALLEKFNITRRTTTTGEPKR